MKKLLSVVVILLSTSCSTLAQTFDWVRTARASVSAAVSALATDAEGSVIAAGNFYADANFDSTQLYGAGRDALVAKFDSAGRTIWVKRFGGTGDDFGNDLQSDNAGNIYLAGSFANRIAFGRDTLGSSGDHDAFLVKLDRDGNPIWAAKAGGSNSDYAMAVAPDAKGNVYLAGYFRDTIFFGNIPVICWQRGLMTMFLAKYDRDGKCLWANRIGASNYQSQYEGLALDVDQSGAVYLAGSIHGEAEIDTARRTAVGTGDLFISKFQPNGTLVWVRTAGAPSSVVTAKSLRASGRSAVYLCGYLTNRAGFDAKDTLVTPLGYSDLYAAKYSADGEFLWVRQGTGTGAKSAESIAVDGAGNSYITGNFADTLRIGDFRLSAEGKQTLFAASFSSEGVLRWGREAGRGAIMFPHAIALDRKGNMFVGGNFNDTAWFGTHPAYALKNAQDLFLARLVPNSRWTIKRTSESIPAENELVSFEIDAHSQTLKVVFSVVGSQIVRLGCYGILGEITEALTEEMLGSGTYEVVVDLKHMDSASYYTRLEIGTSKHTKRLDIPK